MRKSTAAELSATTHEIHKQLLEIANREIAKLPEHLEQLTPAERVRFVLSILPYTAPKVESCRTDFAENKGIIGWD